MRSFLIDEISSSDIQKINHFLQDKAVRSGLEGLFWVRIPEDILSDVQCRHRDCQPHVIAVELGTDWIKLEFFVRNRNELRCPCSGYCTPEQRNFIVEYAHGMIEALGVKT